MAYGNLVDYEPGPQPGTWRFRDKAGAQTTLYGPVAEDLKKRIDATKPPETAQAAMGWGGAVTAPEAPVTDVPAPVPGASGVQEPFTPITEKQAFDIQKQQEGKGGATGSWDEEPTAQPVATEAMPGTPGDVQVPPAVGEPQGQVIGGFQPVGPDEKGRLLAIDRRPGSPTEGMVVVHNPGSAGVSKAQLEAAVENQVETPRTATTTVEGGKPVNEEFLQGERDQNWQRRRLEKEAYDAALVAADDERKRAEAEVERQNAYDEEQNRIVVETQNLYGQKTQAYEKAKADLGPGRVDPTRVFSGDAGTVRAFGAAIAAAMGAAGAVLGRTQNFAQIAIENAIDRDIRAQEHEIATKKENVQNALGDLLREGMTLKEAKTTLRSIQTQHALAMVQQRKSMQLPEKLRLAYEQADIGLQQSAARFEEEYRRESLGDVKRTVAASFQSPRAGSTGGWGLAPMGAVKALNALRGGQLDVAKQEIELAGGGAAGGKSTADQRELAGVIGEMGVIRKNLAKYATDPELNKSPRKEAQGPLTRAWWNVKDWWQPGSPVREMSPEDQVRYEVFGQAQRTLMDTGSVLNGQGVIREYEVAEFRDMAASAQDARSLIRMSQVLEQRAQSRIDAARKLGMPVQEYMEKYVPQQPTQ